MDRARRQRDDNSVIATLVALAAEQENAPEATATILFQMIKADIP